MPQPTISRHPHSPIRSTLGSVLSSFLTACASIVATTGNTARRPLRKCWTMTPNASPTIARSIELANMLACCNSETAGERPRRALLRLGCAARRAQSIRSHHRAAERMQRTEGLFGLEEVAPSWRARLHGSARRPDSI